MTLRFPKRRADWRLGRWTAKHAVAHSLDFPHDAQTLAGVEIRPAASGAPEVFLGDEPANLAISLSHRSGTAACAVATGEAKLGCDLEMIEPRSDAFVADYFTEQEQEVVRQACTADRFLLIALIWSAKESALKVLRAGLRIDTRSLSVSQDNPDIAGLNDVLSRAPNALVAPCHSLEPWRALRVSYMQQSVFQGWWFFRGDLVRTAVSFAPMPAPVRIETAHAASPERAQLDASCLQVGMKR